MLGVQRSINCLLNFALRTDANFFQKLTDLHIQRIFIHDRPPAGWARHGGRLGAEPGDLFILTNVGKHKFLERRGDNVYVTVPITVPEAALGAKIEVPTVEGKAALKIPAGTESGQKFRLRERGFPSLRNPKLRGDEFVEVKITLPKVISEETKELLRKFEKLNAENPRKVMGLD